MTEPANIYFSDSVGLVCLPFLLCSLTRCIHALKRNSGIFFKRDINQLLWACAVHSWDMGRLKSLESTKITSVDQLNQDNSYAESLSTMFKRIFRWVVTSYQLVSFLKLNDPQKELIKGRSLHCGNSKLLNEGRAFYFWRWVINLRDMSMLRHFETILHHYMDIKRTLI